MAVKQSIYGSVKRLGILAGARLWRVELDPGAEAEAELFGLLCAEEAVRAERLANPDARRRFVVARGTLRRRLGDALGESPESVRIEADASGKPRLAGDDLRLWFNVAHCGDLALICISDRGEVGVDIERVRPVPSAVAIARRRFAPAETSFVEQGEAEAIDGQPSEVDRRFLLCWTRKEALVKAIGAGLDFDLRGFTVPLGADGGEVAIEPHEGPPRRLLLRDVPVGCEHMAAVALCETHAHRHERRKDRAPF